MVHALPKQPDINRVAHVTLIESDYYSKLTSHLCTLVSVGVHMHVYSIAYHQ